MIHEGLYVTLASRKTTQNDEYFGKINQLEGHMIIKMNRFWMKT